MIKKVLKGTLIAAALAASAPAHAVGFGFAITIDETNTQQSLSIRPDQSGTGNSTSPSQIRQTVRDWACFDISTVDHSKGRYRISATCSSGKRVQMIFSADSGRLMAERDFGPVRAWNGHRGRGLVSIPAYR